VLKAHIVFVPNIARKLLADQAGDNSKQILLYIANEADFKKQNYWHNKNLSYSYFFAQKSDMH
jgi:hypothetical protein